MRRGAEARTPASDRKRDRNRRGEIRFPATSSPRSSPIRDSSRAPPDFLEKSPPPPGGARLSSTSSGIHTPPAPRAATWSLEIGGQGSGRDRLPLLLFSPVSLSGFV
ncbi:hypothetical protein NL676_002706 [Syzygium grande]|nr:hypothetical protein NL676_002706 [Syzygium grande]